MQLLLYLRTFTKYLVELCYNQRDKCPVGAQQRPMVGINSQLNMVDKLECFRNSISKQPGGNASVASLQCRTTLV